MASKANLKSEEDLALTSNKLNAAHVLNGDVNTSGYGKAFVNNTFSQSTVNFNDSSEEHQKTRLHFDRRFDNEARGQALLDSLFFPEYSLRQESVDSADEDTYEWIFRKSSAPETSKDDANGTEHDLNTEFANFLQGGESIFWITGKPGSGKSTLAKHILLHGKTQQCLSKWASGKQQASASLVPILSYFLWRPGKDCQKNTIGLLRSLSFQLAKQFPGTVACFIAEDVDHHYIPSWTARGLQDAFVSALQSLGFPVFILIDGIDEAEKDTCVTRILGLIQQLSRLTNVKLVTSSRDEPKIRRRLNSPTTIPQLRMQDFNYHCISIHAKTQLANSDRGKELAERITDCSEGVFLWARLVTKKVADALENEDSMKIIENMLSQLPTELEALYTYLFHGIDSTYKQLAMVYFRDHIGARHLSDTSYPYHQLDELSNLFLHFLMSADDKEDYINRTPCSTPVQRAELLRSCQSFSRHLVIRSCGLLVLRKVIDPREITDPEDARPFDLKDAPPLRPALFEIQQSSTERKRLETSYVHIRLEIDDDNVIAQLDRIQRTEVEFLHRSVYDFVRSIILNGRESFSLDEFVDDKQLLKFLRAYVAWITSHVHLDSYGDPPSSLRVLVHTVTELGSRINDKDSVNACLDEIRKVLKLERLDMWVPAETSMDLDIENPEEFRDNFFIAWTGVRGLYDYAWHGINNLQGCAKLRAWWLALTVAVSRDLFFPWDNFDGRLQWELTNALLDRVETNKTLAEIISKLPPNTLYSVYGHRNRRSLDPMCLTMNDLGPSSTVASMFADVLMSNLVDGGLGKRTLNWWHTAETLDKIFDFLDSFQSFIPVFRVSLSSGEIPHGEYIVYAPFEVIFRGLLDRHWPILLYEEPHLSLVRYSQPVEHVGILLNYSLRSKKSTTSDRSSTAIIETLLSLCWPATRTTWHRYIRNKVRQVPDERLTCRSPQCTHGSCCLVTLLRVAQEMSGTTVDNIESSDALAHLYTNLTQDQAHFRYKNFGYATEDFWHNKTVETAGEDVPVHSEGLRKAEMNVTIRYLQTAVFALSRSYMRHHYGGPDRDHDDSSDTEPGSISEDSGNDCSDDDSDTKFLAHAATAIDVASPA